MLPFVLAVAVIFFVLVLAELMWRRRTWHPEYARKLVHISVGTFVAFWPLFLSPLEIVVLSLAFVAVVGASYFFGVFKAIHSVQRPTWGEVFFALAVGFLAVIAHNGWFYMIALLHMSLADGLAAIVGTKFGRTTRYYVFGHEKSIVGTLTFIVISALIFLIFFAVTAYSVALWFIPITIAAAIIENIAVEGLDNLLVPLLVAVALNMLY